MEEQKATTFGLKDASVGYAMLAREVDTNRQLYDSVLQRMKEMGMAAELRTSNVSIIDPAETPLGPSRPNTSKNLLFGVGLGLVGGVGLAFIVDFLDNTLKTPEDVEQYLHLSSLGIIPDFCEHDWKQQLRTSVCSSAIKKRVRPEWSQKKWN